MKATTSASFIPSFHAQYQVGIEATVSTQWFLNLMEELGIECPVGHPGKDSGGGTPKADERPARCGLDCKALAAD